MLLQAALVKVVLRAAVEDALEVAAAVRFLVDLQVLLQIAATSEPLVAELAGEGFLAGVDPLMPDQVRDLGEGLLAARVLAAVRLRLVVDASMLLQRGVLSEGLVALGTD